MQFLLNRIELNEKFTTGKLFLNGIFLCYTLEDTVRKLGPNGEGKIYAQTAIPNGKYQIIVNYSNRFKKPMPLLLNVPFFEGIRIHPGNTTANTAGCILLGSELHENKLYQSTVAFNRVFQIIKDAIHTEKIFITVQEYPELFG